jgi:hypothetical protein
MTRHSDPQPQPLAHPVDDADSFRRDGIARLSGTWTIDPRRSRWSHGAFPGDAMRLVISFRFERGRLVYHSVNDTDRASPPRHFAFEAPLDGVARPFRHSARFNEISVRPIDDRGLEILKCQDGAVIVGEMWQMGACGRQLMRWGVGRAPGEPGKAYEEYFDRIAPGDATGVAGAGVAGAADV